MEVVDDRIPMSRYGPINAKKSPYGAYWLVILEKAYAKMNGFYSNLNGGSPSQAMRDLTGMPLKRHSTKSNDDDFLWKSTDDADKNGWTMSGCCQIKNYNLVTGHIYTILGTLELTQSGKSY